MQLDQFRFGLGHRDNYLEPEFSKEKNAYTNFIRDIAVYLGADEATVDKDVNDVMEFETYMANVSISYCCPLPYINLKPYHMNENIYRL